MEVIESITNTILTINAVGILWWIVDAIRSTRQHRQEMLTDVKPGNAAGCKLRVFSTRGIEQWQRKKNGL